MSRTNRFLLLAAAATAFAALAAPADDKPPAEVELKPVKYEDLKAAVRGLRGKVVVVDFWGAF
jgi:hypothetical protein